MQRQGNFSSSIQNSCETQAEKERIPSTSQRVPLINVSKWAGNTWVHMCIKMVRKTRPENLLNTPDGAEVGHQHLDPIERKTEKCNRHSPSGLSSDHPRVREPPSSQGCSSAGSPLLDATLLNCHPSIHPSIYLSICLFIINQNTGSTLFSVQFFSSLTRFQGSS